MHPSSMKLMAEFRDKYLADMKGCGVLDIGSARQNPNQQTYRELFGDYEYVGMDVVPGDNVDIVEYASLLWTYDVVISGQVLEHVCRPWEVMDNWGRLFRTYICVIAPNKTRLHRCPIHTYGYYPDGIRDLFDYAGIKTLEARKEGNDTIGIGTHR